MNKSFFVAAFLAFSASSAFSAGGTCSRENDPPRGTLKPGQTVRVPDSGCRSGYCKITGGNNVSQTGHSNRDKSGPAIGNSRRKYVCA